MCPQHHCPGGDKIIPLSVEHYVPYLARGTQARPAVAAIEDAEVPSGSVLRETRRQRALSPLKIRLLTWWSKTPRYGISRPKL